MVLFLVLFCFSFTSASVNFYRMDGAYEPSVVQIMDRTRKEGEVYDPPVDRVAFRTSSFKGVEFGDPNHPFEYTVATAPTVRDFMCFKNTYMTEEFRMTVALYIDGNAYSALSDTDFYHFEIHADDVDHQSFVVDGTMISPKGWFDCPRDRSSCHVSKNAGINENDKELAPELMDRFIAASLSTIPFFWEDLEEAAPGFGIANLDAFLSSSVQASSATLAFAMTNVLLSMIAGTFGGLMFIVFLAILGAQLYAKRRLRLNEGMEEFLPSPVPEEPLTEKTLEGDGKPLPELVDGMDKKVADVAKKARLKPFIGEWVVRGIGLGMILIYGVFMGLYKINDNHLMGPDWTAFFKGANDYFLALSACGNFLLTISVVHHIAETRRGLFKKTVFFFSLGFAYYMFMTLAFYFAETIFGTSNLASSLILILLYLLPGNLPMGLGIFCFVGIFLFSAPDKRVIKRRTFRLLSLIPASLAIASLVYSAVTKLGPVFVPYWLANIFFIRDPSFLLIGLGYEYLLFGIRTQYKRYYGENVDKMEALPEVQMVKNIALCGMVVVFNIVFYCIPYQYRVDIGFPSPFTFTLVTIPILLFQKHLGPDKEEKWESLYYLIVIVFTMLPTILNALWSLGSGA